MLLYIPSNKKQYSCKGKYNLWKQGNTFFNEVWPHYHFFSMAFAFNKGISLLQKELRWRQDNSWNRKHDSCRHTIYEQIQDILDEMKPHHYFPVWHLHEKKEFHFSKMMFILSLVSIIWKAYCIHAAISLSKIRILLLHIFCIIAECFNQLIHNLVKVYRKLCTYRQQHMLLGKPFSLRICTQRIPLWHIVLLLPLLI